MKTRKNIKKRLGIWAVIVAAVLLIPFVSRAPWSLGDYILAGVVLFGAASIYEFATKNAVDKKYRIIVALVILGFLMLFQAWAVA